MNNPSEIIQAIITLGTSLLEFIRNFIGVPPPPPHRHIEKNITINSIKIIPKFTFAYGGQNFIQNYFSPMHSKELTSEQIKSIKKSHRRISYLPIESESSCEDYYLINITTDSLTPDDWGLLLGALQIEIENNEQYNLESIDIIAAYSILKSDVCKSMPLLDLSKAKIHGIPAKKTSVINVAYASATNEPTSLFLKPISELNKNMEEIVLYSIDPNVKVCRKPALYLAMNDTAYLAKINTVEGNFFMFFGWDVQENDFKKKDIKMGRKALIEFADSVIRAENNIKLDFMDFVSFNDDKSDQSERIIKEIKKQKRKKIKEIKKTKEF